MKKLCRLTLVLIVISARAATLTDAQQAVRQLEAAARNHDEQFITQTYGPKAYRMRGNIAWSAVRDEAAGSRAVLTHPVRTFEAPGIVSVFGWDGPTLYAAHFVTRKGTLTVEGLHGIRTSHADAERDVIEKFIRTIPDVRLRQAFVEGDGAVISRIRRELGELLTASTPRDSLDALLRRYERVWFAKDCSTLPTAYDTRATLKNSLASFDYAGIQRYCTMVAPDPSCTLTLLEAGPPVRVRASCRGESPRSWDILLEISTTNGAYRITREQEAP